MLVEINLLPQKEQRNSSLLFILIGFLVIFLFAGVYYYFQISSVKSDITAVNREITATQKIRAAEEKKLQDTASTDSASKLKSAIEWADTYPIQTIPVMRQLTSLLPERGFIQSFGYTEAGTISLTVQFDSSREAAYFLNSLHGSDWIEDATLSSLTAAAQEDTTAASTTGTTATSQTTGTSTTTTTQPSAATGTIVNQAVPVTGSPVQPAQNTTPAATTTTTTPSAATAASTSPAATVNNSILPRYTGQFEITLNKSVVKEQTNPEKSNDEGGSGQ
ncbi:PilN domain-containing protein [Neobacillus dielmonensis]|uniref:PilN domain-containing protein n=1 Tax=Neobacillus dielmonensis TaxID=1347369 RepID=UPI000694CCBE|nr:PilN domain-containing protein [Neobacillus dielmonensis]